MIAIEDKKRHFMHARYFFSYFLYLKICDVLIINESRLLTVYAKIGLNKQRRTFSMF